MEINTIAAHREAPRQRRRHAISNAILVRAKFKTTGVGRKTLWTHHGRNIVLQTPRFLFVPEGVAFQFGQRNNLVTKFFRSASFSVMCWAAEFVPVSRRSSTMARMCSRLIGDLMVASSTLLIIGLRTPLFAGVLFELPLKTTLKQRVGARTRCF